MTSAKQIPINSWLLITSGCYHLRRSSRPGWTGSTIRQSQFLAVANRLSSRVAWHSTHHQVSHPWYSPPRAWVVCSKSTTTQHPLVSLPSTIPLTGFSLVRPISRRWGRRASPRFPRTSMDIGQWWTSLAIWDSQNLHKTVSSSCVNNKSRHFANSKNQRGSRTSKGRAPGCTSNLSLSYLKQAMDKSNLCSLKGKVAQTSCWCFKSSKSISSNSMEPHRCNLNQSTQAWADRTKRFDSTRREEKSINIPWADKLFTVTVETIRWERVTKTLMTSKQWQRKIWEASSRTEMLI